MKQRSGPARRLRPSRNLQCHAGMVLRAWWLALAFVLAQHGAALHELSHAVAIARASAPVVAIDALPAQRNTAVAAARSAPVPGGTEHARSGRGTVLDPCDECLLYAAFAGAAPAAALAISNAAAAPALAGMGRPGDVARAPRLAFRSRAPPILS